MIKSYPKGRAIMAKKVNPLNSKIYRAVTTMLTVSDVKAAAAFYQKAFGFAKQVMMPGPDGKPMHAELRLRHAVVMVGAESVERGGRGAKTLGSSPASLYVMVENADKAFGKAVKAGPKPGMPVTDMFWGDRCGTVIDP